MKYRDYRIVTEGKSERALEELVRAMMETGWLPLGAPFGATEEVDGSTSWWSFFQAMVLPSEEKSEGDP